MARAFSRITFTPSVRDAQERYGSRQANAGFDTAPNPRDVLDEQELEFIPVIDTFFLASVGQGGWPYVQHRGGPRGFLKILDRKTLGFADFAGNRQYISVGNINQDDRVMLLLMDFARRRRLKVWGRARVVHESEEPGLIARLEDSAYRARIERGFVITIEALDFNCPQHITPRFTEHELAARVLPLEDELMALRAQMARFERHAPQEPLALGSGPLELVITGMRQLTPRIRSYLLERTDGGELPASTAGSHLPVPVRLADGSQATRRYSIVSMPGATGRYEIAVLRDEKGSGGSRAVHDSYALGTRLRTEAPRNNFPLHDDARPAVLVAGGIGITPLKSMAHALLAAGRPFHLHYVAHRPADMAYREEIATTFRGHATHYFSEQGHGLDLAVVIEHAPSDAVFYVCGPGRLIDAFTELTTTRGIAADRIRYERFSAPALSGADSPIEVTLQRSGKRVKVAPDQTVLDALLDAEVHAPYECKAGHCGTCAVKVVDGNPDHRDEVLTATERANASLMCICVSRAHSGHLVLDL